MELKKALSQIKPTEKQKEKIYGDILDKLDRLSEKPPEKEKETNIIMKKRKIIMSAVACAVVLICGLTVSAANFGWGHKLFGSTSSLVESNMDDYKLKVGNVKIENAEGVPYKFTLGDVITDGELLYVNLLIENIEVEDPDAYKRDVIYSGQFSYLNASPADGIPWRGLCAWSALDATENSVNTVIQLSLKEKIKKGDVFEFRLEDDNRRLDYTNHIDAAENDRAFLGTLSFTVKSDVKSVKKVIDVNKTAIFATDNIMLDYNDYSEIMEYKAGDNNKSPKEEMLVEQVIISPLSLEFKGKINISKYSSGNTALNSFGNVWLVYKNGEKKTFRFNPKSDGYKIDYEGPLDITMYSDYSNFNFEKFRVNVQDLDEIEAIEFDGFTVPLNTNENGE